jgi:hypothetical protein
MAVASVVAEAWNIRIERDRLTTALAGKSRSAYTCSVVAASELLLASASTLWYRRKYSPSPASRYSYTPAPRHSLSRVHPCNISINGCATTGTRTYGVRRVGYEICHWYEVQVTPQRRAARVDDGEGPLERRQSGEPARKPPSHVQAPNLAPAHRISHPPTHPHIQIFRHSDTKNETRA